MPKVSVVIPAYNAEKYIAKTIESILAQTYVDFECLIVDDGSTDNTLAEVKKISDPRIKVIVKNHSGAPAASRNIGLSTAIGEYIFIFDADDLMHPEKIERSILALDKEIDADFLFSNFSTIDEQGNIINDNFLKEYETLWNICERRFDRGGYYIFPSECFYLALLKVNFIGASSVVIRRSSLCANDFFDESLSNADDYLFWVSFLKNKTVIFLNGNYHNYRVLKTGISGRSYLERGPCRIKVLEIIMGDNAEYGVRKILSKRLSNEYVSMSYAHKVLGDYRGQYKYAKKSFRMAPSLKSVKLFVHACIMRVIKK